MWVIYFTIDIDNIMIKNELDSHVLIPSLISRFWLLAQEFGVFVVTGEGFQEDLVVVGVLDFVAEDLDLAGVSVLAEPFDDAEGCHAVCVYDDNYFQR